MSFIEAKARLENLNIYLQQHQTQAVVRAVQGNFATASEQLDTTIRHAERELELAAMECVNLRDHTASSDEVTEPEARLQVRGLTKRIDRNLEVLRGEQQHYESEYYQEQLATEARTLNLREDEIRIKGEQETQYTENFKALSALKKQHRPGLLVNEELAHFLHLVRQSRKDISTPELNEIMIVTGKYLTGRSSKAEFDQMTKELHDSVSVPLKALGSSLIALGFAVAAAGVFFAPAVIMSTASLATIYAATLATAALTTGLAVGGTACFFKRTSSMKLADTLKEMSADLRQSYEDTPAEDSSMRLS